ncbi:DUF5806 family protein [Halorubrum rutilum]|uniref:DUF5806 family protein n=1 Tax=Halorubrum rutilum TaxID=1364933 RepID=A0ABD6AMH8_9EURY|nr:DUF5806 family protein [Halorubrum rutilum]
MNDQPGPASDDADGGADPDREPSAGDAGAPGSLDEASPPSDADGDATAATDGDGADAGTDDDGADGVDAGTDADGATGEDGGTDDAGTAADADTTADADAADDVPPEVRKYERFKKMDGARYERVNEFLRDRTYVTAREWAIARLCADFRTETGVEMTKIGENLPELVPFMTDTYTPQAVNQARYSFEEKVTKAGATFLYGAMSGFFTAEDLDEMMYEVTEVAKFLLEVEGVDLAVADELEAEDKISEVMREVRASSADLRGEEVRCPECGHVHEPAED